MTGVTSLGARGTVHEWAVPGPEEVHGAVTDQGQDVRSGAYASLVSALIGVRPDPATARFDLELTAAEAAGAVDPAVARTLRWWQRESVRGAEDHLARVLPDVLESLAAADREAREAVASSAAAWDAATASDGPPPLPPGPGSSVGAGSSPAPDRPPASGADRPPADPGGAPYLRPVDVGGADAPARTARPVGPLRPGFAPDPPDPSPGSRPPASVLRPDRPVAHDSAAGGAPSPRLLVAGLNVLADDDRSSAGGSATGRSQHDRTRRSHDDVPGASG